MIKTSKRKIYSIIILFLSLILIYIFGSHKYNSVITYFIILMLIFISLFISYQFRLIHPNIMFLAYSTYSFGFGPMILLNRSIYHSFNYYYVILGSLFSFALGSLFFNSKNLLTIDERYDKAKHHINLHRLTGIYMLLFISGIFTVLYLLKSRSIFSSVIFEDARVLAASGNGIIMYGMQLSIIAIPLLYDTYDRANRLNITLVKKSTLIILTSVASITLLTTGYRNGIMSMFIFLIIMYIDKNNINIKKSILLGLLCFMIVSILGLLRSSLSGYHYNFIDYIVKSLYPGVININYVINTFPNKINYQYGSTYLINFVMLLPGPHQDFTLWLKDAIGIKFSGGGVTPTIIGEFYMNFGTKSIYIGMFLLGILGNILGCYFKRHKGSFLAVLYAWQFAHSASGGIANVIINVIIYAIVYKVIMMLPIKELNDCTEKPLKLQIAKQV